MKVIHDIKIIDVPDRNVYEYYKWPTNDRFTYSTYIENTPVDVSLSVQQIKGQRFISNGEEYIIGVDESIIEFLNIYKNGVEGLKHDYDIVCIDNNNLNEKISTLNNEVISLSENLNYLSNMNIFEYMLFKWYQLISKF